MAILKCKMCGGQLDVIDDETVVTCEYCGSKQTIPNVDNEKKLTLFARANRLRLACEFDKAYGVYESIVSEFPEEAEAYWGLVLCKYGIEYVDDPVTGKKIPTCHRSSFECVLEDANFEMTLEYADSVARSVYREEAKAFERIRAGIIEVSSKEEPYDIFICYKETDENGNRTLDSVLAQDVYDALTDKGYKVFFSRITLEDKLGVEYEPYIFAALNSSKIMLVFGTNYEYFTAVWVKNEWSRFLSLIAKGEKKTLIPCYKDIDAYDMPQEFRNLQGQDMNKIGFIQDLIRGIGKVIPLEINSQAEKTNGATVSVDSLIKRLFILIERNEKSKALELLDQVLNIQADNGEAYLAGLLIDLNVKNVVELNELTESFEDNLNYQSILKYGNKQLKETLNSSLQQVLSNKEQKRLQEVYEKVKFSMDNAKTISDYECAIKTLKTISGYNDASKLIEKCHLEIELLKRKQEEERLEKERLDAQRKIEAEQRAQKTKKIIIIFSLIITVCLIVMSYFRLFVLPKQNAKKAVDKILSIIQDNDISELDTYIENVEASDYFCELIYDTANDLTESQKYVEAYILYEYLADVYEVTTELEITKEYYHDFLISNAKVGDSLFLGVYEQDNNLENGEEDIEWIVIKEDGEKKLLLSKFILELMPMNISDTLDRELSTWESSVLRGWLNNDLYNLSFSEKEKAIIDLTLIKNYHNSKYFTDSGNDTEDYIFLLSEYEVKNIMNSELLKSEATEYCKLKMSVTHGNYWLRTKGAQDSFLDYYAYILDGEEVDLHGTYADRSFGVRPAMWIDLSK